MTAAQLLDRLDGVRATGPDRWLARCPAHEDRTPSLSIRELDDGRVLLHDFGGCGAADVVAALGLELKDLFPDWPHDNRIKPPSSRIPAADALAALDHEVHVVAIIGADILAHQTIDQPTWDRLARAVHQIGDTRALITPLKIKGTQ